jgi:hypothetical protein
MPLFSDSLDGRRCCQLIGVDVLLDDLGDPYISEINVGLPPPPLKCGGTTPCAAAESAGCTQLVPVTSSPQDGAALFASCLPRQHASLARNPKMRLRTP